MTIREKVYKALFALQGHSKYLVTLLGSGLSPLKFVQHGLFD